MIMYKVIVKREKKQSETVRELFFLCVKNTKKKKKNFSYDHLN